MLTRVAPVTTWFDRLAADVLGPSVTPVPTPSRAPRTSARTVAEGLELRVELPGVAEEDIEISVDGRTLAVAASRLEGGERWTATRKVTIGEGYDLDATRAHYQHGLLTLVVPPVTVAAKRISITPAPAPAVSTTPAVDALEAVEAIDTPAGDTPAG